MSTSQSIKVNDEINNITSRKKGSNKTKSKDGVTESTSDDIHLPVTEIHLKSHEWFGDFITKHEIPRKVFHSSIGFITLYLYTQGIDYRSVATPLIIAFVNIFILDLIRLRWSFFNKLYCRCVGALMRKKEIHTYNGVLWYLLGLIFSFSFFSKDVCLISLFLLSWSDTAASTFGRKYGHLTPKIARNKSLAGSLAAFTVGLLTCLVFYGYFVPHYNYLNKEGEIMWSPESSRLGLMNLSWLGGLVAALSEGIDIFNWDDNFTIPVLSSIFLHSVIYLFRK
ncbi:similar to Saccharomyces cerevisiae YOR311C DGK1 Diacylglycerol kinase, localized to the endoplasmic reticulum (ER) [Maudiozyma barnettii]|uniref:Similar to Saccharomyces cerevisiae YOR311C DGK1 Diacylglycerol kinase, localized to the endoplasmic reticulum (ER) n=1 Tax=Maudiozyma barnettii TaxID=61262 RepID=A0A8H2VD07_9SACH|nr:diacylglycerol kinase [Kazachstania barnettii]CAB4252942.1 similar to Saccharomyces cerevisiae YOR311C DGK1 Diacylglycerol kinase, localized to the endoplasmic reticulum (ER) [Kazachstania barnettii]CAD1780737.1 similar to Saccharomyces cerevisiae YOR311C DGK1 Diacylglycerol kinase, localized to the endoplasmic reticulum (ER) [Kazachstania barnettii]